MTKLLTLLIPVIIMVVIWRANALFSGRSLKRQSTPLRNDEIEVALRRLAHAAGIDGIHVRVLNQDMINGLVTPSGDIYVTRGLVNQYHRGRISLGEFTSVVAHELGHLAHGHTKRRIWDVAGAQLIMIVLGGILVRLIPFVGYYIARWLGSLFVATLSRKDEFEADSYATALMIRAGFGAEPQARMLEKLVELVPGAERAGNSWLASHPPVAERAAAIRGNAQRWDGA
ncbi:M48 family metalloprotease [Rhodobacteraceae bacterium NNCM2]|nr:M48 family metalloprotease [Coraliihabitans acroporae]